MFKLKMSKRKKSTKPTNKLKIRLVQMDHLELSGFLLTDEDKLMLEIMCEKMIKDLSSILTHLEDHKKMSSKLYIYERKKNLLKSILISNKTKDDQELKNIQYQLVRDVFC